MKAVEKREAIPIAARKESLSSIFASVAVISAERMEELASKANLRDAGITAGIATEKMLLLQGDATLNIQHSIGLPDRNANWFDDRLKELAARLQQPRPAQPALANGETAPDSGAIAVEALPSSSTAV